MNRVKWSLYSNIMKNNLASPPRLMTITNLLHSYCSYKLKKTQLSHSPVSAVLYINKTCNYDCVFCYNKDILNQRALSEDYFSIENLDDFLNSKHGKKVLRVALMGGEPFVNQNIFTLIKELKRHRKIVNIVSNGSLIDDNKVPKILESRLDAIGLSLYDNNKDHISRLSRQFSDLNINFWVQTVVDATIIENVTSQIEFAIDSKIKNFILSNYNPYFDEAYDKKLHYEHLDRLRKIIKKYKKHINVILPTPLPEHGDKKLKKKCTLPFNYIHLDSEGLIGPCCYRYPKKEYGNLYSNGWNSEYNQKLRENLLDSASEPLDECSHCENLYRSLYF